ncbi:MFS transporter [Actinosynnema sp. ALI-1.44]|uniref:MFS transporter n=1 Tax=Actinosynnema sp. ALI-1.44 TaxID=1933779 RepID=UPI00097C0C28|nr:MFS transporter [Actinosynnema sp. ALI-1.44]ONI87031.1 MFS transporter [Actinosynnema sp. ALI-1.44]
MATLTSRTPPLGTSSWTARTLLILLVLDLTYLVNAMDRQVFSILLPDIKQAYLLTANQAGTLSTIFTLGMGLAGVPAGYLADRFGRKRIIAASLLLFSVTCALQATAAGLVDLTAWRILSGVGEGAQNAALYAAVGAYFHRNRAVAIGSINAAFGLGAFGGPLAGGALLSSTGDWRVPLFVFGGIGVVILVVLMVAVPQSVTEVGRHEQSRPTPGSGGRFFNRRVVCCTIATVAAGFTIYGYLGLYPTYLREAHGYAPDQTAVVAGMFGLGALTSVFCGIFADRFDQRWVNVVGFAAIAGCGAGIFLLGDAYAVQIALSLVLGIAFTGVVYTNTSALIQRSVPSAKVGRATGLFVAAMYIPASVSGYFFAATESGLGWQAAGVIQLCVIPVIGIVAMAAMGKPTERSQS